MTSNSIRILCGYVHGYADAPADARPLFFRPYLHHLYVLPLRIDPVHQLHALLVHGKDNTTAHDQSRQSRERAAPEGKDTLLLEDDAGATERVSVQLARLNTLHARLDRVERLGHIDSDEARNASHSEGARRAHLLPWRGVALGELLQSVVYRETGSAVRRLARRRGHEALEETPYAAFTCDDRNCMEEAAEAGLGRFAVVDAGRRVSQRVRRT